MLEPYGTLGRALAALLHRLGELHHRPRGRRLRWPRELAAERPTVDVHDLFGVADLLGAGQPVGERGRQVLLEEIARLDEVRVAGVGPELVHVVPRVSDALGQTGRPR